MHEGLGLNCNRDMFEVAVGHRNEDRDIGYGAGRGINACSTAHGPSGGQACSDFSYFHPPRGTPFRYYRGPEMSSYWTS